LRFLEQLETLQARLFCCRDADQSERPAILLGSQVWSARGHREAIDMVRALNIPAPGHGDPLYDLAPHATAWLQAFRHLGIEQVPARRAS